MPKRISYDRLKVLDQAPDLNEYDRYYFGYQYGLGREYLLPYLRSRGVLLRDRSIAEIGCGEGGVLAALADEGSKFALGIDIRQEALDRAEKIFPLLGIPAEFHIHDVTGSGTPETWRERFELVLLRDVMEHLEATEASLRHVAEFVKPGGFLYVVFPPYYSPYGAHQHLLKNFWGKLPYIQFFPEGLFEPLIRSGFPLDVEEVRRLRGIRLTRKKFLQAVKRVGLEVADEELFLIRPVFKLKFGLPPIRANFLKSIPGLREIVALEASFLLRRP